METIYIKNVTIYTENDVIENGALLLENGQIKTIFRHDQIGDSLPDKFLIIDGTDLYAIPGFIDGHIHGANGSDVMDGTAEALDTIAAVLPAEGTTSFLATTITQAPENLDRALINVAVHHDKPGHAEMIGVHLEGPFIEKSKAGAQPKEYISEPDIEQFRRWQQLSNNKIKTITMAPEHDADGVFIHNLNASGVNVSAGHTSAGFAEMKKAAAHGVCQVTHICNAMTGIHHRDIGAVGAAMQLEKLRAELIADGIHVSNEMLQLLYNNIGSKRLMLITDAIRAKCLQAGNYELGGQPVTVTGERAELADGTLAGSILKMHHGAQRMFQLANVTFRDIIQMTSVNQAKQLGIFDKKASITTGKDADVLLVDAAFNLKYTICRGVISYEERKENDAEIDEGKR
jgi:N-acetylglucosamine-6-phosphate deacetylase